MIPIKAQRINLFDTLPPEQWRRECPSLSILDFENKRPIYFQGNEVSHLFLIAQGHVKLSRINSEGKEYTIALLSCGEFFGPLFSDSSKPNAQETATAKGLAQIYQLRREEFETLLSRCPGLAWRVIQMAYRHQHRLERRLSGLLFDSVEARVAQTLYELMGHYGEQCTHGIKLDVKIDLRLNQQELADLVCASRPVVSRILNSLRDRGILDYDRDFICIIKIQELENLIPS